jgi:branched-chain amino acid transport system permease protein
MLKMLIINGLVLGGMYAMLAIGFSLVFGVARILNMGHTAFYMVTAFLIYIGSRILKLPFLPSVGFSILIVGILGIGCYQLLFDRVKEHETAIIIISIAVAMLFQEILLLIFGGQYNGIPPFFSGFVRMWGINITYQHLLAIGATVVTLVGIWFLLTKTKLGIKIRCVSQDKEIANLMGINVGWICTLTMGISALLAGIASAIIAPIFMVHPLMWVNPLIITLAAVVLGGLGSIKGGAIAAFLLGFAETIVIFLFPQGSFLRGAISLSTMIAVLLVRPQGLFGIVFEEELL